MRATGSVRFGILTLCQASKGIIPLASLSYQRLWLADDRLEKIQNIGTRQIRVVSITYHKLTYSYDRENYVKNSQKN